MFGLEAQSGAMPTFPALLRVSTEILGSEACSHGSANSLTQEAPHHTQEQSSSEADTTEAVSSRNL